MLIIADDFGWTDLGCYGSDLYESPHIDRLARDGMRFTQNYSACTVCSPTRAALMTGKYPARLHITDWIPGQMPDNPKLHRARLDQVPAAEETTIAEVLARRRLCHGQHRQVAPGRREYYPEKHGFDLNIAGTDKPQPQQLTSRRTKIATLDRGPEGRVPHRPAGRRGGEVHRDESKTSRSSCTCRTSPCTCRSRPSKS